MRYQCENPLLACVLMTKEDGTKVLTFKKHVEDNILSLRQKYGSDNVYEFGCGSCEACRINYSHDWAIRCSLEAQYHKFNYFVTLTYCDERLKYASHHDFKRFIEKLQGIHHENKIAYFACMELGEHTGRKHYHCILFMDYELDLYDKKILNGFDYYHSKKIAKAWPHGLYNVTPFSTDCATYVAKYCNKGQSKIFMSRNIGKQYFYDNREEIIKDGFVLYGNFGKKSDGKRVKVSVPRVFYKWFSDSNKDELESLKKNKLAIAKVFNNAKARDLCVVNPEQVSNAEMSRQKEKLERRKKRLL